MKQAAAHRIGRRLLLVGGLGLLLVLTSSAFAQATGSCMVDTIRLHITTGGDDLRGGQDNLNVTVRWGANGFLGAPNINNSANWANGSVNQVDIPLKQPVALSDIKSLTLDHLAGGGLTISPTTVLSPIGLLSGLQSQDNWDMASLQVTAIGPGVAVVIVPSGAKRFTGSDPVLTLRAEVPSACPSGGSSGGSPSSAGNTSSKTTTLKPTTTSAVPTNFGTPGATSPPARFTQQQINTILTKLHSAKGTLSPIVTNPASSQSNSSVVATLAQQKQVALTERGQGSPTTSTPSSTIQTASLTRTSAIRGPASTTSAAAPSTMVNQLAIAPASNVTIACTTLHGPSITTVSGQQGTSAVFTQDPQYNLFTIRGCNFGQNKGQAQLSSTSGGKLTDLTIDTWTDTLITAEVPSNLIGITDQDNVALVLLPSGGSQVAKSGFHFYAKRAELHVVLIPASQVSMAPISDASGIAVTGQLSSPYKVSGGNVSGGVDRINPVRFGGGTDVFDFSKLKPGFSIEKFQLSTLNPLNCEGDNYTDGNWSSQLSGNAIRVSWQEQHCHNAEGFLTPGDDISNSSYGLDVWLVGPVLGSTDSPWQESVK